MVSVALVALLREYQVDENQHVAGTLIDHLIGTHDMLERWGAPQYLCVAGLFHSVYGTQLFHIQSIPFEQRGKIRQVIGDQAESLAYLFCVSDRATYFNQLDLPRPKVYDAVRHQIEVVSPAVLRDLIELEVANLVEFIPRMTLSLAGVDRFSERFESARDWISQIGLAEARQALAEQRTRDRSGPVNSVPVGR